ncbi:MAG TPA: hypothetical protein VJJ83_00215, partial [Candidatus Babeliales bacterium]|nr:hypothetical protein [Candidatus Babeliales bacterium]
MDKTTLFLLLLIAAAGGGYYGYRTSPSFKNHVDQARAKISSVFCSKACSSCSAAADKPADLP